MEYTDKAIGIDFGGTSIKMGIVLGKQIVAELPSINPKHHPEPKDLIRAIADQVKVAREDHDDIRAIGCGVPGFVHTPTGTIHNLTNVPGWTDIPLQALLSEATGLPCVVENDANAMGIAEWKLGAGQHFKHLICLTLGTGVGGAVIVNNQIIRGAHYVAGELGQTSIHYAGRLGAYNNAGALEDYIGNNEFAADSQAAYKEAGIEKDIEDCTPAAMDALASHGDEIAIACWDDFAKKLACAIANCCWILNPEAIVIGGGISKAGDTLFVPLRKHVLEQLSGPFKDHLKILPAKFGNEAGIIGCATLALESIED
ncbi:glucokinase [Rubritalea squalenifaciens DSM 18772]|uniref:Glucokinase n=2 Tax=Rubritalea TaxID=361050 RepID=A0A1M6NAE8_9BACT|nr:ROK family protein [Rubritalea squalenifaciens]SHJ92627.1 glucokinase [Rubritalea squalenifaciens DSM 18772]